MADFIAVIRRAVDGLNDNTPEVRARVYEKARAAVQRQLENMKPQPPEEMLRRQMEKLDNAIEEVESEYALALAGEPEPEIEPEEAAEEIAVADPQDGDDAATADAEEPEAEPVAAHDEMPAYDEPSNNWDGEQAATDEDEPVDDSEPEQTAPEDLISDDAGDGSLQQAVRYDETADSDDGGGSNDDGWGEPEGDIADNRAADIEGEGDSNGDPDEQQHKAWPVEIDEEPAEWVEPEQPEETSVVEPDEEEPPVRMPKANFDETRALEEFGDLLESTSTEKNTTRTEPPVSGFSWDAPFEDLPEPPKPVAFQEALAAKQSDIKSAHEAGEMDINPDSKARKVNPASTEKDPLADLDELIGYSRKKTAASSEGRNQSAGELPDDVNRVVSKLEGRSFKTQPKQKNRKAVVVALAAVAVLALAGGGFALWYNNRADTVASNDASPTKIVPEGEDLKADTGQPVDEQATDTADTGTADTQPVDTAANATPQDNSGDVAADPDPANAGTEVAALETPAAGPLKFTQRLLTDGSETAGEGDPVSIDAALPEGTSMAGQTVASAVGDDPATATTGDAASTGGGVKKPADSAQPILGVTQKMFLYEERLGQGTPTATAGTVSWNIKNEAADNGKAEPVIEGHIDVPGREFKALITIKRNTDKSLPASHIIEIVFQLPKDFEGGNIESVERIALKQNEQDRGNALIAVPAKITDDFHMVALNDDKDAVANNNELLKSRAWIDIPIKYRNGRRALITLEKGASGTTAFDKAMTEWAALGNTAQN